MEPLSEYDKLRFYRDEVKHEFNLLAMRSNILVTCQSFLIVPFAILNTAANFSDKEQPIAGTRLRHLGMRKTITDLVSSRSITAMHELVLEPCQFMVLI